MGLTLVVIGAALYRAVIDRQAALPLPPGLSHGQYATVACRAQHGVKELLASRFACGNHGTGPAIG